MNENETTLNEQAGSSSQPQSDHDHFVTAEEVMQLADTITQRVLNEVDHRMGMAANFDGYEEHDSSDRLAQHAARLAAGHLIEAQKPALVSQIAQEVAQEYGPEVAQEVAQELMGMPGQYVATVAGSARHRQQIARYARGLHAERAAAPASSPTGTVRGSSVRENDLADKFWNDYKDVPGFTKDLAREMARERA